MSGVLLAGLLLVASEPATDAARMAAARSLVSAMDYGARLPDLTATSLSRVTSRMVDACAARNDDPKLPERERRDCIADSLQFERQAEPVLASLAPEMRRKQLEAVAEAYASQFSTVELEQLTSFYSTEVGRTLAARQPAVDQALVERLNDLGLDMLIEFLTRMKKTSGE
ncbi:DUF2059 domain-containing protein [Sphingomonas changnyeongensis]|uniref:DUF2059 domain-containing protein n=1 Tax=Sphingomonas changnyeongensis TaxID=2698679 RepID=A0A7Z2NYC2_9SPHN|nr:DUF2059 domain-containing protein [Sphingomonas changnyeongensis]QHL91674.1 DUF2059 domain-containing protein [Sphingomonas changnyeongensis]